MAQEVGFPHYSHLLCTFSLISLLYFSFPGGHSSSGVLDMSVLQIDVGTQAVKRDALLKCLSLE